MRGEQDDGGISQAYQDHRPYLVDLAFRMLGDISAAEDIVQDAFTRLMATRLGEIEDKRGWLIVVTSRLCLDQIKSARSRRERAHDASEIEFVAPPQKGLADPADRVTFDDGVRLALLVVLQQLSPAERVAFVLHDIFQMPFDIVAETVGRSAPACRQLASRARQKIAAGPGTARFDIASAEHQLVTEKFIAACSNGDLNSLLGVLAPDAWGDVDLGPGVTEFSGVFKGANRVARNLLRFWGQGSTLVSLPVGGQPAVLAFTGRQLAGVLVFTMRGELIQAIHVIGDPRKLDFLSSQLTALALEGTAPARARQPGRRHYPRSGLVLTGAAATQAAKGRSSQMNSPPERAHQGTAGALEPVGPSLIVKIVMRPMTKMLNPLIVKLAGRRHFHMAAQIRHAGRRSGRTYTTPVSARRSGDMIVIALTFGNQSDWSRNVRSAGGGTIRIEGEDYNVTQPQITSRQEARPLVEAAFSPMERVGFRVLGIKQVMILQVVSAEHQPRAAAATNAANAENPG